MVYYNSWPPNIFHEVSNLRNTALNFSKSAKTLDQRQNTEKWLRMGTTVCHFFRSVNTYTSHKLFKASVSQPHVRIIVPVS